MRGLYEKYVVFHPDGQLVENECFVLVPRTDPVARIALKAYARATPNAELKLDLATWLGWLRLQDSEESEECQDEATRNSNKTGTILP